MTVIDVGCASYQTLSSIQILLDRFHPDVLLGFDPNGLPAEYRIGETQVRLSPEAVWTRNGECAYDGHGYAGQTSEGSGCPCRDIVGIVDKAGGDAVLKIDAEGAEYQLLDRLWATGRDKRLSLLLVEWHEPEQDPGRAVLLDILRCPVEEWAH